ncbi:MAG: hypothetical protein PVG39_00660 [Desulfobacteraceae bacterium]|jgi:hypothetical protein
MPKINISAKDYKQMKNYMPADHPLLKRIKTDILLASIPKGKVIEVTLKSNSYSGCEVVVKAEKISKYWCISPALEGVQPHISRKTLTHMPTGFTCGVYGSRVKLRRFWFDLPKEIQKYMDVKHPTKWNTASKLYVEMIRYIQAGILT